MTAPYPQLDPPARSLLGPGPSDVAPSVLAAMARPTVGHLDPVFLEIMDQIRGMQRELLGTRNECTMPMSGTGSAGMETCFVNLLEPGDEVLVGVHGVFGTRMADVAQRCGAKVTLVEQEWGRRIPAEAFEQAIAGKRFKLIAVVHAETSTGVLHDMEPMRAIADRAGALLLVDAVTSVAGLPVRVDDWGVDALYSGTQKCLSCPPGLSPVTFSSRAMDVVKNRASKVQSWYLDLSMIGQYWGAERAYHHTAPINMLYGFHEALRIALDEGLEERFARHRTNSAALWAGLEAMGLELLVPPAERLVPLTSVRVPDGVDEARLRRQLLEQFDLEIGGGLGPLKGRIVRIGLMGSGSTRRNVTLCLSALHTALRTQGFRPQDDPLAAADAAYGA